ncbi:homeostatic response regulator transcription factor HsrA [Helicobacter mustelae]|uniref:Two-component regulator n=1 Tax=Helicobacter mustelae (strain ATCC 43772 / CCUG 25715 / CIP 103759 / LMG 18044 / NCTC 12198 / R85-136P) TaxID=679897 RepID=D3UJ12_HELM1|nr:homeostatic response regulator transcription factor HsrA [Helicobacter mustelae]CBG40487.1 two-component regulator [Helicobacter mustelae 12198]SQH71986.1 two-component regulator [Helicobacter mustelae]STP13129.1 two-component regulator [Helicobacter mustelae]
MRILLIDKDDSFIKNLNSFFTKRNYQTDVAGNLKDGYYFIDIRNYDVVLLSCTYDDASELLVDIKAKNPKTIIIVTDKKIHPETEIKMFKLGADDYIPKPSDENALLARIEARLRFSDTEVIKFGDLIINPAEERISYKEKEIEVKGKPFEVLTHLARHKDRIVSKEQLLDAIWEEPELVTPNVIEVAINQIRQKLDKPLKISTVETVRRRGYRFCYSEK